MPCEIIREEKFFQYLKIFILPHDRFPIVNSNGSTFR